MKKEKIENADAQKQECSSPSLQPSLRRYTLAFVSCIKVTKINLIILKMRIYDNIIKKYRI